MDGLLLAIMGMCGVVGLGGCASRPRPVRPPERAVTRPALRAQMHAASRPVYYVSPVGVQTLEGHAFLYLHARANYANLPEVIERLGVELSAAADEGRAAFTGPLIVVFPHRPDELDQPIDLEVGHWTASDAAPPGPFRRRVLPPLRSVVVSYAGPAALIDKAYDRLVPALSANGLQSTQEVREIYSRRDGPAEEAWIEVKIGIGIR